jgi:hypothetical protein
MMAGIKQDLPWEDTTDKNGPDDRSGNLLVQPQLTLREQFDAEELQLIWNKETNPGGLRLEVLLDLMCAEIAEQTDQLAKLKHPMANARCTINRRIMDRLKAAEKFQREALELSPG